MQLDEDWFQRHYLGERYGLDTRVEGLALAYHVTCELFDRTVCTGPIRNGSIMPANRTEGALINAHASKVLRELRERAASMGITSVQLHYAIRAMSESTPDPLTRYKGRTA